MNLEKLGSCEIRKVSADELIKEKLEHLPFLKPTENEPNNYSMQINMVTVHDIRSHKISYSANFAYIKFYDSKNKRIATICVCGSNEYKRDECFYIGEGSIISETDLRVMNSNLINKIR